ncbi:MAG: hypothetical protein FJY86_01500 [Candidatus Diapherotrites archaeon]|uniref:DOD-type homing endonuclease domain-containing protein n=1 Tax=Candidatus Iainarchaeum sp. TaxID=3101447 RepID=A0A8T4C6H5_9ARCH|nr:hypothetical protein [Candidatus Diapherotrites archaeon]
MENRILIGNRDDSISFFKDAQKYGKFKTQHELCQYLKLSRGHFWKYYIQELTLPESLYSDLLEKLPLAVQKRYTAISSNKPANWGSIKGGITTQQMHPNHIVKARNIAIQKVQERAANIFDINQPLTTDISEFLGAFAGDGFTNKYDRHYFTGFAGDRRYDWNYYQTKIIPIAKKHFNIEKQSIREKDNSMWVTFHCKLLHEFITQRFGMPSGEKWNRVLVPKEIMEGKIDYRAAFVRGVFDTDGCVFFDKRAIYKEPYMRVDITMVNIPILTQLHQILTELGVESKVLGNGKHLHVTSKENVRKFFEKIGSSNERHKAKIRQKYSDFDEWNPASTAR